MNVAIMTLIHSSLIYVIILLILSLIFSICICGKITSSTSVNFKCGFYSITSSLMRYRYNYWMILIHFIISEQESMLSLPLIFGNHAFKTNNLIITLPGILFIDTFFIPFALTTFSLKPIELKVNGRMKRSILNMTLKENKQL